MITQKRVKELYKYYPKTGVFIRRKSAGSRRVGSIAGCHDIGSGYIKMSIDDVRYLAHRVAWLYVYGYMPENGLDHINRIKSDNRISNLREASQSCNMRNARVLKNNTSGVKGVSYYKPLKKWRSQIGLNKKSKFLGYYDSFCNAVCARLAGEQCLNWSGCDSSSPVYIYVENMINRDTVTD